MKGLEYTFKTVLLLGLLSALLLAIGYVLDGQSGVMTAFVFSMIMNVCSYWFSDKIVLAMHQAKEVGPDHQVYQIVRELTQADGLPMPKVYVVPDGSPNAFTTGRNPEHAAVCVTEGLMKILDRRQVRAVLSHELSYVQFQAQTAMPQIQAAFNHLYIVNHFSGRSLLGLFSTHPTVKERIRRLRSMSIV